jgi:molybdate transport system substrate-binding protein
MKLHILSGGAAQGLVAALAPDFEGATGCRVEGTFGAVGAMRERLLGGTPADILILTEELIGGLERDGRATAGSAVPLGVVRTGVAVRAGAAPPPIGDAVSLAAALRGADAIYFPDPERATAGIHFKKVLDGLGLAAELAPRLRPFANGAAAMAAMAGARDAAPLGCTQVTEIRATAGVALVGPLPKEFELATIYAAAVASDAAAPDLARRFVDRLAGAASAALRRRLGFEER